MSNFVQIYSSPYLGELALIKARLDGALIKYYVKGEFAVGNGRLPYRVFVQAERVDEARRLIREVVPMPEP